MTKRPPLGIMPRWAYEEQRQLCKSPFEFYAMDFSRMLDLRRAMGRYRRAGFSPSIEWFYEASQIREFRLYHSLNLN